MTSSLFQMENKENTEVETVKAVEEKTEKMNVEYSNQIEEGSEKVDIKVVFNKKKYEISFGLDDTIGALKVHLADIINVPNTMQKVMFKGLAKDEMSLRQVGVVKVSKVMVVGSTLSDLMEMAK